MSWINLMMAKFHYKQWQKYEKYYRLTEQRKKESKKLMQEYLDKLDCVDFLRFAADTGYIDKRVIKKRK